MADCRQVRIRQVEYAFDQGIDLPADSQIVMVEQEYCPETDRLAIAISPDKASYITGTTIDIFGGAYTL